MICLGFTQLPLGRQNLVYALRKLTELNALDTISATVYFWCLLTARLTADPKLHKNDLARLSHWIVCQVFAGHQPVHVAKLVSGSVSCVSEALRVYIPFTNQAEMTGFHVVPFEQVRRLAANQDCQNSTNWGLFGA
jgi:hypothetical protein